MATQAGRACPAPAAVDRDTVNDIDDTLARLDRLVDGLRAGDREAFHDCYQLTADLLASIAVGMVGDRRDAEEVVQDVFVRLARHASDFQGDGRSLRAWLVRTARNAAIDRLRARARRPEDPTEGVPDGPDPHAVAPDVAEFDPRLVEALQALTERQRTAVVLRHVAGLSGDEIAAVIGGGRDAVYALLGRAERALRRHLDPPVRSGRPPTSLQEDAPLQTRRPRS